MFTEAPAVSRASSSAAEAAASVVWWCVPQLSNQPFQNSAHISGPLGCRSRKKPKPLNRTRSKRPGLVQLGQGAVLDHGPERLVAGEQRDINAQALGQVNQMLQIGLIVPIGAVFVFDLEHDHRTALR